MALPPEFAHADVTLTVSVHTTLSTLRSTLASTLGRSLEGCVFKRGEETLASVRTLHSYGIGPNLSLRLYSPSRARTRPLQHVQQTAGPAAATTDLSSAREMLSTVSSWQRAAAAAAALGEQVHPAAARAVSMQGRARERSF